MDDTLFTNATVLTMNAENPRVSSVYVADGKVAAIGEAASRRAAGGRRHEVLDLHGATLIPGFHDNHIHVVHMGDQENRVRLVGLDTPEIIAALREFYGDQGPNEWVYGSMWDYTSCPHPHRRFLDKAYPDTPVLLTQFSGHAAWLNSRALEFFRIDRTTPDWPGGTVVKDPDGEPTGVLREPAAHPRIRKFYFKRLTDSRFNTAALRAALAALRAAGVTSVQDNTWLPQTLAAIGRTHAAGELTCRLSCWSYGESFVMNELFRMKKFNSEWYRRGPVKFFADGAFSSRSAWLIEPYADENGNSGSGKTAAQIAKKIKPHLRLGRSCAIHAIGDRAVREICDAAEMLTQKGIRVRRSVRIEHAQLISPPDIARIRDLGLLISAQPAALTDPDKDVGLLGPERARSAYPYRSLIDAGVRLSFGSDYPGERVYKPIEIIHMAVNRTSPERITAEEALRCYTIESAYAEGTDGTKGSITPGKVADFTVLSHDITSIDPAKIRDTEVLYTVVGGKIVYAREN